MAILCYAVRTYYVRQWLFCGTQLEPIANGYFMERCQNHWPVAIEGNAVRTYGQCQLRGMQSEPMTNGYSMECSQNLWPSDAIDAERK